MDVFLAGGHGRPTVEVCPGVRGKALFHPLKIAGTHAERELIMFKWPVLITNGLALSITGLWRGGGESYATLATASDCQTAHAKQVGAWSPPTEHKLETRRSLG